MNRKIALLAGLAFVSGAAIVQAQYYPYGAYYNPYSGASAYRSYGSALSILTSRPYHIDE